MTGTPGGERIAILEAQMQDVKNDVAKLQGDVDGLKRFQAWLTGIAAAVGVMGAVIANGIKDWLRH